MPLSALVRRSPNVGVVELAKSTPQPAIGYSFLLQSNSISKPVRTKVVEEGTFLLRQPRRVACVAVINGFLSPEVAVSVESVSVHQERTRVREMHAKAVQYSKTMRVNITPIVHVDSAHPCDVSQSFKSVAKSEHDDTSRTIGK
jgi:hypothetical protein